ncbi:MAG: dihydroneopterin aldolase [Acidobacteria bacterium]|nr:MAG: dihydroneopterin aldolase [Acidobacteriota bacterium]
MGDAGLEPAFFLARPSSIESVEREAAVPGREREERITLSGIKLRPRIGVSPGERRLPQPCEADVTLWGDFQAAARADALDQTVDYSAVLARVESTANSREYNLIETLARAIARAVLEAFPVRRVEVRLRKRPASLKARIDFVEVVLEEN